MTAPTLGRSEIDLVTLADAELITKTDKFGVGRAVHHFMGSPTGAHPAPQGFLAHMPPVDKVQPHFHRVDQFQLLFGADGARYLRSEVPAGTVVVHYTDAFSVYGPFEAGAVGLDFFTLRAAGDSFIGYMPESRADLVRKGRRNVHRSLDVPEQGLLEPGASSMTPVITPDDDGLAAFSIAAGPGAVVEGPDPALGGGQYYCVVGGAVESGGRPCGVKSLGWLAPDSSPPLLRAGSEVGFQVVVMQFPSKAGKG